jgi:oxygen-dependent protoporphyrinogen oxidase
VKRAVLLIGFGGPDRAEDIRPFLANVLKGRPVSPERVEEVVRQYEKLGGRSPYNSLAEILAQALEKKLAGNQILVTLGMRNWAPSLSDVLGRLKADGVTDLVGVVLAAYRSIPSWNYYLRSTADAFHAVGGRFRLRYVSPWHSDPLFEKAVVARVQEVLETLPVERRSTSRWYFTAHSIPIPWDESSGYSGQIRALCQRVANGFQQKDWSLVYQSRSGRPETPWLEPDVSNVLERDPTLKGRDVVLIPIGFLMDHVEVLFDLDIKAREAAERVGAVYHRAKTVGLHGDFLDMLKNKVLELFPTTPPTVSGPYPKASRRVVVVGGGLSGLSAAHRVWECAQGSGADVDVKILDAGSRPGGVVETVRRDGFLWEGGPDSFITEKPAAIALARRLGFDHQIRGTNRLFQQSFVARDGNLLPTPEGFYLLAPTKFWPLFRTRILSWPGKVRAAMELIVPPRRSGGDESLASFVRRRFGQEILDRLAQPMVAGIYSADPETLSLQATFPRFLEMEAKGGVIRSLLRARQAAKRKGVRPLQGTSGPRYGLFAAFEKGVGSFLEAILQKLPAGTYVGNSRVTHLERSGSGWLLKCNGGDTFEADGVLLAVPSPVAAGLMGKLDGRVASLLSQTPYGDVATVNVAVRRDRLVHPLDGFGFVVPQVENRSVTGCTFSSVKFPGRAPEGFALLRAFVAGDVLKGSDDSLRAAVLKDLQDLLGLHGNPEWMEIRRYPAAMPHYTLGHVDRVRELFGRLSSIDGLALAGNGYMGIGLPDCVASGEAAADRIFRSLQIIESTHEAKHP